jgi:hypothetical protein
MPNASVPCRHEGCAQKATGGKGYCARHYAAWKRGKMAKPRYDSCGAEGCHKRVHHRGRCEEHFARDYPGKKAAEAATATAEATPSS